MSGVSSGAPACPVAGQRGTRRAPPICPRFTTAPVSRKVLEPTVYVVYNIIFADIALHNASRRCSWHRSFPPHGASPYEAGNKNSPQSPCLEPLGTAASTVITSFILRG
ncbi:uncharacterized protein LOC144135082 [Amblyomma americanum]